MTSLEAAYAPPDMKGGDLPGQGRQRMDPMSSGNMMSPQQFNQNYQSGPPNYQMMAQQAFSPQNQMNGMMPMQAGMINQGNQYYQQGHQPMAPPTGRGQMNPMMGQMAQNPYMDQMLQGQMPSDPSHMNPAMMQRHAPGQRPTVGQLHGQHGQLGPLDMNPRQGMPATQFGRPQGRGRIPHRPPPLQGRGAQMMMQQGGGMGGLEAIPPMAGGVGDHFQRMQQPGHPQGAGRMLPQTQGTSRNMWGAQSSLPANTPMELLASTGQMGGGDPRGGSSAGVEGFSVEMLGGHASPMGADIHSKSSGVPQMSGGRPSYPNQGGAASQMLAQQARQAGMAMPQIGQPGGAGVPPGGVGGGMGQMIPQSSHQMGGGYEGPGIGGQKAGLYNLDQNNYQNFTDNNNAFALNRTVVNKNLVSGQGGQGQVDFCGYNSQGEQIRDVNYFRKTPGRTGQEAEFYAQYKKTPDNNMCYPGNTDSMGNYMDYDEQYGPTSNNLAQQFGRAPQPQSGRRLGQAPPQVHPGQRMPLNRQNLRRVTRA